MRLLFGKFCDNVIFIAYSSMAKIFQFIHAYAILSNDKSTIRKMWTHENECDLICGQSSLISSNREHLICYIFFIVNCH